MDQLYFDDGYLEVYYFTIVREAAATFSVTASQSFSGDIASTTGYYIPDYIEIGYFSGTIKQAEANLATAFTLTATITHIEGIALFAFSDAAISLQVSRIREINVTASAVFDIATDFVVARSADADVDAVFSAIIAGLRSRDVNLTTQAAFSFAANADNLQLAQADLSVTCSISATAIKIRDVHLTGTGVAALTCSPTVLGGLSAQLQSTAVITANVSRTTLAASALTAVITITTSNYFGSSRPRNLNAEGDGFNFNNYFSNNQLNTSSLSGTEFIQFASNTGSIVPKANQSWVFSFSYTSLGTTRSNGFLAISFLTASDQDTFANLRATDSTGTNWRLDLFKTGQATVSQTFTAGSSTHKIAVAYENGYVGIFRDNTRVALIDLSSVTSTNWQRYNELAKPRFSLARNVTFDEFHFATGTRLEYNPQSSSVSATGTQTNVAATTQALYHFTGNGLDDITLQHFGQANLISQCSVSAYLSGPVRASCALVSTCSLQATISHIEGADLVAFANTTLTVNADKLRIAAASISAVSNISTTVVKTANAVSNIAASSNFIANVARTRIFNADFTAFVSQLAGVVRIAGFIVDDISVFSQSVIANKTGEAVVSLSVTSTLDCTATRIKQFNAATSIISTFTVDAIVAKIAQADLVMAFAVIASDNRIRGTGFAGQIDSQLLAIGNNLTKIEFIAFALGSLTVVPNRRASLISAVVSDSTVNASGNRIRNLSAALSNNTAITTVADVVTSVTVTLQAFVSQITAAVELSDLQAEFSVTSSLAVSASRTRNITTAVIINTAVAVIIGKISGTGAAMPSSFAVAANGGRRVNGQATIASAMQFTVTVREIRLDNIVYVIPGETRVYAIKGETRIHKIRQETRIYTI